MSIYSCEQLDFLRDQYVNLSRIDLTEAFNARFNCKKTVSQIVSTLKNHKITSGRTGHFKNGSRPWNDGVKGSITANATSFKKGQIPANAKPLGSERICPKDGYVLIKVAEKNPYTGAKTRYRHKHVYLWEKEFGAVPKGKVVTFLDGDKGNFSMENLVLTDRKHLCRYNKNRVNDLPTLLIPSMKKVVDIKLKVLELTNSREE